MGLIPLFLLSPRRLIARAQRLLETGDMRGALQIVDRAIAKLDGAGEPPETPLRIEALQLKGGAHRDLRDDRSAVVTFLEVVRVARLPWDDLVYLVGALVRERAGGPEARAVYLTYLRLYDPASRSFEAQGIEELSRVGAPGLESMAAARAWNEDVRAYSPESMWAKRHLGEIALRAGDAVAAVRHLEEVAAAEPLRVATQVALATGLTATGRYDEACAVLDRCTDFGDDGHAIVLRGHLRRRLGNEVGALGDYTRAAELGALTSEVRLALAETLVRRGRFEEAAAHASLIDDDDPRRGLLMGAIGQAQGDAELAVTALLPVLDGTEALARQAARRLVAVASADPGHARSTHALFRVPDQHRNAVYWTVVGNGALATGDWHGALRAWSRVHDRSPALAAAMRSASRAHVLSLYERGDDTAILAAIDEELVPRQDRESIDDVIIAALERWGGAAIGGSEDERRRALERLRTMEQSGAWAPFASTLQCVGVRLVVTLDDPAETLRRLQSLAGPAVPEAELAVAVAAAALRAGRSDVAAERLAHVGDSPEVARVRLASAILARDWVGARALAKRTDIGLIPADLHAAILALGGRDDELPDEAMVQWRAVGLTLRGRSAEAMALVDGVDDNTAAPAPLVGWVRLRAGCEAMAEGREDDAATAWQQALRLWPGSDGAAEHLTVRPGIVLPTLLVTDRPAARRILMAGNDRDSAACRHRLAVFDLADAHVRASEGDWNAVFQCAARSIAGFASVLVDAPYVDAWARRRCDVYAADDVEGAADLIEPVLTDHWNGLALDWRQRATQSGAALYADRFATLNLILQAEIRAARALQTCPDIIARIGGPMGAIGIDLSGMREAVAAGREHADADSGPLPEFDGDDPIASLDRLLDVLRVHETAARHARDIELLFSGLRIAKVLEDDGRISEALAYVRGDAGARVCLWSDEPCRGPMRAECPTRRAFVRCHPAFAHDRLLFGVVAARYEASLAASAGDHAVAEAGRMERGLELWDDALAVAPPDFVEEISTRIRTAAIGRAKALGGQERWDAAINLLRHVAASCGDDHVRAELAQLFANRGIIAGNAGDWRKAVDDLRSAYRLNPAAPRVIMACSWALGCYAPEVFEQDREAARSLVAEANEMLATLLRRDPRNDEVRSAFLACERDLGMLNIITDKGAPIDRIRVDTAETGDVDALGRAYSASGMHDYASGSTMAGIASLELGHALLPNDPSLREPLVRALHAEALRQARDGSFDIALRLADSAAALSPNIEVLELRRAIAMAEIERLIESGDGESDRVQELLAFVEEPPGLG